MLTGPEAEILARHLGDLRLLGRTEGTIYARRRAIIRLAGLLPVPLLEASAADLLAWRSRLRTTENTIVHYASHVRVFYAWCVRQDLIGRNPADALLVPVLARGKPRPIGDGELIRAVESAPARIRPWLVLAGWAGLRAKEIALLRRERVLDTHRPPVLLVAADATKGHRERVVPMSSFVVAELRAAGLPRAGWVFRRADGRPGPNGPHRVSQAANAYLHSIGIEATLHQARHRFASVAYGISRDIRVVQELLGHADPATTAVYTAYNHQAAIDVVEALPAPAAGLRECG